MGCQPFFGQFPWQAVPDFIIIFSTISALSSRSLPVPAWWNW